MPEKRKGHVGVSIEDRIFVVGGRNEHDEVLSSCVVYNRREEKEWTILENDMPTPRTIRIVEQQQQS